VSGGITLAFRSIGKRILNMPARRQPPQIPHGQAGVHRGDDAIAADSTFVVDLRPFDALGGKAHRVG